MCGCVGYSKLTLNTDEETFFDDRSKRRILETAVSFNEACQLNAILQMLAFNI